MILYFLRFVIVISVLLYSISGIMIVTIVAKSKIRENIKAGFSSKLAASFLPVHLLFLVFQTLRSS